jgi:hypothetical protein
VIWISDSAPAGLTTDIAHFERHVLAALRFRVGIPARALAGAGVECAFIGLDRPAVLSHLERDRVDAVIFAKLSTRPGPAFEAFSRAHIATSEHVRARGIPLVVDLVDNVFETDRASFFDALLQRASTITVCTSALARVCRERTGVPVHVVPDPAEGVRRPARFVPPSVDLPDRDARPLRLLWFGAQYRTFLDLAAVLPALQRESTVRPIELAIVTSRDERITAAIAGLDAATSRLAVSCLDWSLDALDAALDACDVVFLPADVRDAVRIAASPNRAVRALWAGRAVVANPLPSYRELADAPILHEDVLEALRLALADPPSVEARIAAGQAWIAEHLAPAPIGRRWLEVLGTLGKVGETSFRGP